MGYIKCIHYNYQLQAKVCNYNCFCNAVNINDMLVIALVLVIVTVQNQYPKVVSGKHRWKYGRSDIYIYIFTLQPVVKQILCIMNREEHTH